jgi:ribosomal-protein-serine acetyltransferase
MFGAPFRPGFELRLVEERHVPAIFAAVDRERQSLRQWLPWVDATRTQDDTLALIRASLEQFAPLLCFVLGFVLCCQGAGPAALVRMPPSSRPGGARGVSPARAPGARERR